jgi:hypothetical protein
MLLAFSCLAAGALAQDAPAVPDWLVTATAKPGAGMSRKAGAIYVERRLKRQGRSSFRTALSGLERQTHFSGCFLHFCARQPAAAETHGTAAVGKNRIVRNEKSRAAKTVWMRWG